MSSVTITANSGAVSDQRCKGPTTSITNPLPSVDPWVTDIYCHGAHTLSLTESRVLEVPPHWLSDGLGCVPTTQQIALSSVFPVGVQDRDSVRWARQTTETLAQGGHGLLLWGREKVKECSGIPR